MTGFVYYYSMVSASNIITKDNNLWGFIRFSKSNSIVYRDNINGIWKNIRGIAGSFLVWNYHQYAWRVDSNIDCHNQM